MVTWSLALMTPTREINALITVSAATSVKAASMKAAWGESDTMMLNNSGHCSDLIWNKNQRLLELG